MRVHPDTYPTRLTSFIAQTPSGIPQWFDWDDATTPRTDAPARFIPRTQNAALLAREGFNPGSFTLRGL